MADVTLKPVEWVGSSKRDLKKFPDPVQDQVGFAVYQAQAGLKHRDVKPMKGFLGASVLEVALRYDGDTYRAVYTVRFKAAIYVLHAFQKKAKRGAGTPKPEINLITRRLQVAELHYRDYYDESWIQGDERDEG